MTATDAELLQRYANEGSQDAFALLVGRYLDMVYTAARRQVHSPQLAEDVTQSVFIKLSVSIGQLKPGAPLVAWLYLVTRHTALKALRHESRRLAREQTAFELSSMNSTPSPWSRIEPLLDEAMESLHETSRGAVLLRYFDNKSLREVGAALGTTEDAAQKRVSRALEELREFLGRRGVAVTASGLVTGLSQNAIQAAPAGLGPTIVTVAALTSLPPATITAASIAMTTIQKALTVAVLAALLGAGLYEKHVATAQDSEIQALQAKTTQLAEQEKQALKERDDALAQLGRLDRPAPVETPEAVVGMPAASSSLQSAIAAMVTKAQRLQRLFDERPERKIPELQLLTDDDWIKTAQQVGDLGTERQIRDAFARLRFTAKVKLALDLAKAIASYKKSSGGVSPPDLSAVTGYFDPPLPTEVFARYTMVPPGGPAESWRLVEKESALVDDDYDNRYTLIASGGFTLAALSKSETVFQAAMKLYATANNGDNPASVSQLQPFLTTTVDPARLEELLDHVLHPGSPGGGGMGTTAAPKAGTGGATPGQ